MEINAPITLARLYDFRETVRSVARRGPKTFDSFLMEPLSLWCGAGSIVSPKSDQALHRNRLLAHAITAGNREAAGHELLALTRELLDVPALRTDLWFHGLFSSLEKMLASFIEDEIFRLNNFFAAHYHGLEEAERERLLEIFANPWRSDNDPASEAAMERRLWRSMREGALRDGRVISYLVRFAIPRLNSERDHASFLFDDLGIHDDVERSAFLSAAAVMAFHEMAAALSAGSISRAVSFLGRYALLAGNDPSIPYRRQVDLFRQLLAG